MPGLKAVFAAASNDEGSKLSASGHGIQHQGNEEQAGMLTENSRHVIAKDLVGYRMRPDTRMIKMSTKKRTRQEHRSLQWNWVEDLYLSQEKKIKPHSLAL